MLKIISFWLVMFSFSCAFPSNRPMLKTPIKDFLIDDSSILIYKKF
jgi:hypothetical protein